MSEPYIVWGAVLTPNGARHIEKLEGEIDRLRAAVEQALDLNRQMWSEDEDNDSPGNMQHAILVHALEGRS